MRAQPVDTVTLPVVQVPEGHVWLQGDNTLNSTDSRTYGPVPYALLKGRAIVRFRVRTQPTNPQRHPMPQTVLSACVPVHDLGLVCYMRKTRVGCVV